MSTPPDPTAAPGSYPPPPGYPPSAGEGVPPYPPPYGTSPAYGSPPGYGTQPPYVTQPPYGAPPTYGAPGYGAPGYGAPTYGGYPYPAGQSTDGVSVAALVTGLLQLNVVALVLGIVGLNRVRRTGNQGRGMAIAGIVLGGLQTLAVIVVVVLFVGLGVRAAGDLAGRTDVGDTTTLSGQQYGDNPTLDGLWDQCATGDGAACDTLYQRSEPGSVYEQFGSTCAGTTDGSGWCADAAVERSALRAP